MRGNASVSILLTQGSSSTRANKSFPDTSEHTRKVHAVRDCFKDILLATGRGESSEKKPRIPSLAAMCCMVIGGHLEDDDAKTNDEKEAVAEHADDIYNAIPEEYRR